MRPDAVTDLVAQLAVTWSETNFEGEKAGEATL